MKNNLGIRIILCLFIMPMAGLNYCTKKDNFKIPDLECELHPKANISFEDLYLRYEGETIEIVEDLVIEGYVISSDSAGNFFGTLHIQDHAQFPTSGIQIEIDLTDAHIFYNEGSRVIIKLQGLYLGKSQSIYKIGGVFNAFGQESVGRLPANLVKQHIFKSCQDSNEIVPLEVSITDLNDRLLNNLITINNVEIAEEYLGQQYALAEEDTEIRLNDCNEQSITLLNSGYSDFQNAQLPDANGSITAVLHKANKMYQLIIRDTTDIDFNQERCDSSVNEMTSNKVFFTEIADPDNNNKARFIELYNASEAALSLDGWTIKRYTNDNTEVGSIIDLTGQNIVAKTAFVISADAAEFETVYGLKANYEAKGNSAANSNGDDNLELVDPFGNVIDVFGKIGEDGSGTNHEFEDGRAVRKPTIIEASSTYNFDEWIIYNDTGAEGTIKMPQNAPEDFTPGIR